MARGVKGSLNVAKSKAAKRYPMSAISMELKGDLSARVRALGVQLEQRVARTAAGAGADLLYREMRKAVPRNTGKLHDSIYQWFDQLHSYGKQQVYRIGPNKGKARHWAQVEYGHYRVNVIVNGRPTKRRLREPVWVPAQSYIRWTYNRKIGDALRAAQKRFLERAAEELAKVAT